MSGRKKFKWKGTHAKWKKNCTAEQRSFKFDGDSDSMNISTTAASLMLRPQSLEEECYVNDQHLCCLRFQSDDLRSDGVNLLCFMKSKVSVVIYQEIFTAIKVFRCRLIIWRFWFNFQKELGSCLKSKVPISPLMTVSLCLTGSKLSHSWKKKKVHKLYIMQTGLSRKGPSMCRSILAVLRQNVLQSGTELPTLSY